MIKGNDTDENKEEEKESDQNTEANHIRNYVDSDIDINQIHVIETLETGSDQSIMRIQNRQLDSDRESILDTRRLKSSFSFRSIPNMTKTFIDRIPNGITKLSQLGEGGCATVWMA